jgi:lysophospholipase L1-like esterase
MAEVRPKNGNGTADTHESPAPAHFGWKKTILYSLLPLIFLCVVLEGGARIYEIFQPPLRADYGLGFSEESRVFRSAGLFRDRMVTKSSKEGTFPPESFQREKPENEYRIFMIGGSNVNYLFHRFPDMEKELGAAVPGLDFNLINAGGCAYGSQRLVIVAHELMSYAPDMLMIYAGHNEFEELEHLTLLKMDNPPLQRILYASAFSRIIRDYLVYRQVDEIQQAQNEKIFGNTEVDYMAAAAVEFDEEELANRMARYEQNLDHIIQLCLDQGVRVVLGTVATNYYQPDFPPRNQADREKLNAMYAAGQYEEGLAFARNLLKKVSRHQASDVENGIIRKLAAKHNVPLADVEAAIIAAEPHGVPGETLFGDRCHVNEEGKTILLQVYEDIIVNLLREPGGDAHALAAAQP